MKSKCVCFCDIFGRDKINFIDPICPIVSNYDASINISSNNIIENLKLQMSNRVRWTESIIKIEEKDPNPEVNNISFDDKLLINWTVKD